MSITPGQTALKRTPSPLYSSVTDFVSPFTPCLLATYELSSGNQTFPAIEEVYNSRYPGDGSRAIRSTYPRNTERSRTVPRSDATPAEARSTVGNETAVVTR